MSEKEGKRKGLFSKLKHGFSRGTRKGHPSTSSPIPMPPVPNPQVPAQPFMISTSPTCNNAVKASINVSVAPVFSSPYPSHGQSGDLQQEVPLSYNKPDTNEEKPTFSLEDTSQRSEVG